MKLSAPKSLHQLDRPREKLIQKGPEALTNLELLQVIISSGSKVYPVQVLAKQVDDLLQICNIPELTELEKTPGVGSALATRILASIELGRRAASSQTPISSPQDVWPLVRQYMIAAQEHLVVILLSGSGQAIKTSLVTIGTLNNTLIHPREVFANAISARAASLILVHNHPSGEVIPSHEDTAVTSKLVEAGNLLGISIQDHLIFNSQGNYYSFKESGDL